MPVVKLHGKTTCNHQRGQCWIMPDFLLVINSNLPPGSYLALFSRYSLVKVQNRYIRLLLFGLTPPRPTEGFPWDDLRKIFIERSRMAKVPKGTGLHNRLMIT